MNNTAEQLQLIATEIASRIVTSNSFYLLKRPSELLDKDLINAVSTQLNLSETQTRDLLTRYLKEHFIQTHVMPLIQQNAKLTKKSGISNGNVGSMRLVADILRANSMYGAHQPLSTNETRSVKHHTTHGYCDAKYDHLNLDVTVRNKDIVQPSMENDFEAAMDAYLTSLMKNDHLVGSCGKHVDSRFVNNFATDLSRQLTRMCVEEDTENIASLFHLLQVIMRDILILRDPRLYNVSNAYSKLMMEAGVSEVTPGRDNSIFKEVSGLLEETEFASASRALETTISGLS